MDQQIGKFVPMSPEQRFWSKVNKGSGCWMWGGKLNENGYGIFSLQGRHVRAHRVAYELTHGTIEPGMVVRHSCDNRGCVNPEHLESGTHQDNGRDASIRGRVNRTVVVNRKLTEDNVRQARADFRAGRATKAALARRYGVTVTTISQAIQSITWKHVI